MNRQVLFKMVLIALAPVAAFGISHSAFAQSAGEYLNKGLEYTSQGYFDDALDQFNKALELDPNSDAGYFDRGLVYVKKGNSSGDVSNYDKALADFNKVLGIISPSHPKISDVYVGMANAYHGKGDLDTAAEQYGKAIQVNPNDELAYENRGLINYKRGKFDEALADYNKAVELAPDHGEIYLERGMLLMQKGDAASDDLALADFDKAIQFSPDDAEAYNSRAIVYYIKKNYDQAWLDVRKAQSLGFKVNEEFLEGLKQVSGQTS
jgi:tetratricopeptide (TPR) repeat protein